MLTSKPITVSPKTGLMNSHTVSPSGVTWKMRPRTPSQISVLPPGSRTAPEIC